MTGSGKKTAARCYLLAVATTVTLSITACGGGDGDGALVVDGDDDQVIILPTYGYQISASPAAGPLTAQFLGDSGLFVISVTLGNTLRGDVNVSVDVDNDLSIVDFSLQSLSALHVDSNVGLPLLGAFDIQVTEDMLFSIDMIPASGAFELTTATETVTLRAFTEGVELRLDGGEPVIYAWDELEIVLDDEAAPLWQRRAVFAGQVIDFVLSRAFELSEALNLIDDRLATINPLAASCDPFTGSPPSEVLPQGESTFTWMGSGPAPMSGDDFQWAFTDCWFDDATDIDDILLNGSIDLRNYAEIIDAQSRLIGTGFDEVIFNDFEIADTVESPPGTFSIDPRNRVTISGGFDLAFIGIL